MRPADAARLLAGGALVFVACHATPELPGPARTSSLPSERPRALDGLAGDASAPSVPVPPDAAAPPSPVASLAPAPQDELLGSLRAGHGSYASVRAEPPPPQTRAAVFFGTKLMARSVIAVIVSDGFTPGLADTAEPSATYSPS